MSWRQLSIALGTRDPAPFETMLVELGAVAVSLEDAGDQPLLEPAPGTTPLWERVTLKALFEDSVDSSRVAGSLRAAGIDSLAWEQVADRIWERAWMEDFEPMCFGAGLWVCPHGRPPPRPAATTIWLDPGLAFGTGRHATTALCLEWLAATELRGRDVLDYGCGSGILAIAAARLGARRAIAVDTDELALAACESNARANGVADRVQALTPDRLPPCQADIVIANILAVTLTELATVLAGHVTAGGDIVLSGILDDQAEAVCSTYEYWFAMGPPVFRAGWARLTGKRRNRVHTVS